MNKDRLKVLFASVEVSPFAKVGGLADVAGSLPKALQKLGHEVRVLMPGYGMVIKNPAYKVTKICSGLPVSLNPDWSETFDAYEIEHGGLTVWAIANEKFFSNVSKSEEVYTPGVEQYLFLTAAAFALCEHMGWIPDVIHANDWHTGFMPVWLRERADARWQATASTFSIHNLAYQGEFDFDILLKLDLPHHLYHPHALEAWGRVNFLKSGMTFADQVNTVSPTYALEIQNADYGCNLQGVTAHLSYQGRFQGILNGIDLDEFDPAQDPYLSQHFSAANLAGKAACRAALLKELNMEPIDGAPLMAIVSRLSSQKGMELVLEAAERLFSLPAQLVVLGSGDSTLAKKFRALEKKHPRHFRFSEGFNLELAPRIYAGSDIFLMPSLFEPCGLGQLIALRYGTVPVVRHTGGLADTIREGDNGFVFESKNSDELLAAVVRAHACYHVPECWKKMIKRSMACKVGWESSAKLYERMYRNAVAARQISASA